MKLLKLKNKEEYKKHFIDEYCKNPIITFDKISVKFYEDQFEHAFFESDNKKKRDKSIFSTERAERMDWIKEVLQSPKAELFIGWDRDKKRYNKNRRVSIINEDNYVVIINTIRDKQAKFITAYPASKTNAAKIRSAPKWEKNNNKK